MPEARRDWGCDGPSPEATGFVYDLGGVESRRCPLALIKQRWVQKVMRLYTHYETAGLTPNGRGLRHETAFYREAMMALKSLSTEAEGWYSKELDKRNRRNQDG